jgi:hypothetical protein
MDDIEEPAPDELAGSLGVDHHTQDTPHHYQLWCRVTF